MLPAKHRLRHADEITHVLRHGRARSLSGVRVYALPTPTATHSRVACVVGKKVSRLAVQRHKYQRWLRVVAAELIAQSQTPYDIVFVAQPGIVHYERLDNFRQQFLPSVQAFISEPS